MKIIGFSGKIGSGKNYIAEHIFIPLLIEYYKNLNITILPYFFSFADHLKVECLARIPYNQLDQNQGYNNFFINKNQETRVMLQQYGTENGRNNYHNEIWIRAVNTWIDIQYNRIKHLENIIPIFIISDVRFKNEAEFIEKNGVLIRINALNRTLNKIKTESNDIDIINKIMNHQSEIELDDYNFKYIIDNDKEINKEEIIELIKYI